MVVRKTDEKTNIKNALVITLIYSLKHLTTPSKFYGYAKKFLEEYTGKEYSHKEIDKFSKELLLKDNKLEKILRRSSNISPEDRLDKFGFSTIYTILKELKKLEVESLSTRELVERKPLRTVPNYYPNGIGVLAERRSKSYLNGKLPKNRKRYTNPLGN